MSSQTRSSQQASEAKAPAVTPSTLLDGMTDRSRSLYTKAAALLDARRPEEALRALYGQGMADPLLKNLAGVCLMRSGRASEALDLYRPLVWTSNGLILRTDVPVEFLTNFATGLLMLGRIPAANDVLQGIPNSGHPAVQKLRQALAEWASGLSFGKRWLYRLGFWSPESLSLSFPPGDLPQ